MITQKKTTPDLTFNYLDKVSLPVFVFKGKRLVIEYANERVCSLLGKPCPEIRGKAISEIFPEAFTLAMVQQIGHSCLELGGAHVVKQKEVMMFRDGKAEILCFNISCDPVYDDSGRVAAVVAFLCEVTDQQLAKNSFQGRSQYIPSFFRKAPVGIVCYRGPEFVVEMANDRELAMWGKTLEEVQGRALEDIFPEMKKDPVLRRRMEESRRMLLRGEAYVVDEVELTFTRDGNPYTGWFSYIHEPYTDASGEIAGMIGVTIELTREVQLRKKLQLVMDAFPALISYINAEEEYEIVNKAYQQWFGRSEAEFVGKKIGVALGVDAYRALKPHIEKVLTGSPVSFESWVSYQGRGKRYISASYVPHTGEQGEVLGFFVLVNDLTERRREEELMREKEERLRLIAEGTGAGTFEYDLMKGVLYCSDQLKEILGMLQHDSIDGESAKAMIFPDDLAVVLGYASELQSTPGGYMAFDCRIIKRDTGEVRWVYSRSKIMSEYVDGKLLPVRLIGFAIDISERKESEEALKKLSASLETQVRERTTELSELNRILAVRNQELVYSQSFLKLLIDSSVEIIAVLDTDLRYLTVNKRFEEAFNKRAADVEGKSITEVFPHLKDHAVITEIRRGLQGERINLCHYDDVRSPAQFMDTHLIPLTANNIVEGVIVMARDVTKMVTAERDLENVNRQLKEAQRLSRLGSWEWNFETGKVEWSDEMYRIYGYAERFPVDFTKATERMNPADAEKSGQRTKQHIRNAVENFRKSGETTYEISPIEFPITLPDGGRKSLRSSGRVQLSSEGKIQRILGVIQDVTDIRAKEEQLKTLVDELELKNRDLESFNYVASHDLQEPLRKIQMFIDRLRTGGGKSAVVLEDYLNKIDRSAKRMTELVQSMLLLSRLTNASDEFTAVNLNNVLDHCRSDLELRIRECDAVITNDPLPVLKGSDFQLQQLFVNLISNALKFCERRPVLNIGCVQVDAPDVNHPDAAGRYWRLSFEDNGIGFDVKYKEEIFEAFKRLHPRHDFVGSGIGLSIVKRIVDMHGGFIDVWSRPGEGSTFVVWFPVMPGR